MVASVATRAATLRAIVPICLSRVRTPASRVYSLMTRRNASSSMISWSRLQSVLFELPRDEVHPCDVDLFFLV